MVEKLAIPFFALGDSVRLFERQLAFKDRRIRRVARCRGRGLFRLRRRATGGRDSEPTGINVTDSTGATTARQFYVSIPSTFDPSTPYRLIFASHYYSGSAAALAAVDSGGVSDAATSGDPPPVPGFYGVQPFLPDAIYVAGQGLPTTPGDATTSSWTNANGEDIAFTKAMIAWTESNFCVDPARILTVGMSVGGYMSNTIGCEMPDVFRAIAVMSGSAPGSACKSHDIRLDDPRHRRHHDFHL